MKSVKMKLKQKIQEDLVKSPSVAVSETNPDSLSNLQSQSMKELLDSASHKPRLSKTEKRRNTDTCAREDETNKGEKTQKKKREANKTPKKTEEDNVEDDTESEEEEEEDGIVPKKLYATEDGANRADDQIPALAVPNEVNSGNYSTATVSISKIRKRLCYACGEKGHLSTSCPNPKKRQK